jgi:hypothetical protein
VQAGGARRLLGSRVCSRVAGLHLASADRPRRSATTGWISHH